jgi:hypothetical protein
LGKQPGAAKATPISLEIPQGVDVAAHWEKFFATQRPAPAAVREAVRQLMANRKYASTTALISAALRHDQAQPWMYEALVLAMQLNFRPREEIERAIMSAADFADNATDLMSLGHYLVQNNMDRRALGIFRQVSRMEPLRPEPYLLGLRAAQRIDDLEGLKWATLGILRQVWSRKQIEVWKTADRVAKDLVARLKAQNRQREAAEYEAALQQAGVRDCAIVVSWTGEADVDILVEEPSGSVCSLRNPPPAACCLATRNVRGLSRPVRMPRPRFTFAPRRSAATIACSCGAYGGRSRPARSMWKW